MSNDIQSKVRRIKPTLDFLKFGLDLPESIDDLDKFIKHDEFTEEFNKFKKTEVALLALVNNPEALKDLQVLIFLIVYLSDKFKSSRYTIVKALLNLIETNH